MKRKQWIYGHEKRKNKILRESETIELHNWLTLACKLYRYPSVQKKHRCVDMKTQSLIPFKEEFHSHAIAKVISTLSDFPLNTLPDVDNQIQTLIDLTLPIASLQQKVELESLRDLETSRLWFAIQNSIFEIILQSDFYKWTPTMIELLHLNMEEYEQLAVKWAPLQSQDNCLRENDALIWLIKKLIPTLPPQGCVNHTPSTLARYCWFTWRKMDPSKLQFLLLIQSKLPTQFVENLPIVFYTLVFRHWCFGFPQIVQGVIRYLQADVDISSILNEQLDQFYSSFSEC